MRIFMLVLMLFIIRSGYFTVESGKQVITFNFKKIMLHDGEGVLREEGSVHLILPQPFGEVLTFLQLLPLRLLVVQTFGQVG